VSGDGLVFLAEQSLKAQVTNLRQLVKRFIQGLIGGLNIRSSAEFFGMLKTMSGLEHII